MAGRFAYILWIAVLVLAWTGVATGDSILLDDGTTVEGTIVREGNTRIVIETPLGRRTYMKRRVRSIVRDEEVRLPRGTLPASVLHFYNVDQLERELANARAMYVLAENHDADRREELYREILKRLDPLMEGEDDNPIRYEIRWMVIESHERLTEFDRAIELLEDLDENGREQDKLRAKAHLDILEQNPDRSLRRVNRVFARSFLKRKDRIRAKEPDALAQGDLMRKALEQYCDQILLHENLSIHALKTDLDRRDTLEALLDMPERASDVMEYLPFARKFKQVEDALNRAEAILPGYTYAYKVDLARSVSVHLYDVLQALYVDTVTRYPEPQMSGDERGLLTAEERREWREYCGAFESALRPLMRTAEFMLEQLAPYPENLRRMNVVCQDMLSQLEQVRYTTNRKKGRTRV